MLSIWSTRRLDLQLSVTTCTQVATEGSVETHKVSPPQTTYEGGSLSVQSARRLNLQLAADDLQANTSLAAEWRLTSPPDMGGRRCIAKATPLTSGGIAVNPVRTQTESSTGGSPVHRENYTIDTKRTCKRAGCQPTRRQSPPCPDAAAPGQNSHLCQIVLLKTIFCTTVVMQSKHLFWRNRLRGFKNQVCPAKELPRHSSCFRQL